MKLVIFGSGKLADLALYYFENDTDYDVAGFTVHSKYMTGPEFRGHPVVPFETVQDAFPNEEYHLFVAMGYSGLNKARQSVMAEARTKGFRLASYVSSHAVNYSEELGENAFILENAVLQPYSKLGEGVIVWSGTVIGHHSTIGDGCYFSPGVAVSGTVDMGERVFVGAGVSIRDRVSIAADVVIGTGATVTRSLNEPLVYCGTPARPVKALHEISDI